MHQYVHWLVGEIDGKGRGLLCRVMLWGGKCLCCCASVLLRLVILNICISVRIRSRGSRCVVVVVVAVAAESPVRMGFAFGGDAQVGVGEDV